MEEKRRQQIKDFIQSVQPAWAKLLPAGRAEAAFHAGARPPVLHRKNMLGRILMEIRDEPKKTLLMNPLIEIWREIILGDQKSWVLFKNGTCVILMEPQADLSAQATALMKEWGPVHAGSSAGDFGTIALDQSPGWVVTSHHNDILTYVSAAETSSTDDVVIGLLGRSKRNQDAQELEIVHVEDKRNQG